MCQYQLKAIEQFSEKKLQQQKKIIEHVLINVMSHFLLVLWLFYLFVFVLFAFNAIFMLRIVVGYANKTMRSHFCIFTRVNM